MAKIVLKLGFFRFFHKFILFLAFVKRYKIKVVIFIISLIK
jgi:hypothetical protein